MRSHQQSFIAIQEKKRKRRANIHLTPQIKDKSKTQVGDKLNMKVINDENMKKWHHTEEIMCIIKYCFD